MQAKEHHSQATDISLWLGIAHERIGNTDIAVQQYEKATKELISDLRPWVLISQLLAENGRCAEAQPWLINAGKRGAMAMQEFQQALQLFQIELQLYLFRWASVYHKQIVNMSHVYANNLSN